MIMIVSGLPRSGTSLLMQMLAAAEVPIQTDGIRMADSSNPRGYFEWERIKQLPREPWLVTEAEGKAVKIVSPLLMSLPKPADARIVFIERPLEQVVASQAEMIRKLGAPAPVVLPTQLLQALHSHRGQVLGWLANRTDLAVLKIGFANLIRNPQGQAGKIAEFLNLPPEIAGVMAAQVDATLCHQGHVR